MRRKTEQVSVKEVWIIDSLFAYFTPEKYDNSIAGHIRFIHKLRILIETTVAMQATTKTMIDGHTSVDVPHSNDASSSVKADLVILYTKYQKWRHQFGMAHTIKTFRQQPDNHHTACQMGSKSKNTCMLNPELVL